MAVLNLFEDQPGWTNAQRAEMAALATYGYSEGGYTTEHSRHFRIETDDITYEDIIDLMTDLYHLADLLGFDLEDIKSSAGRNYEAEQE